MKSHVTAIGVLHLGLGILGILIGALVFVVLVGAGILGATVGEAPEALPILSIVALVVAVILAVTSVPGIIAGVGLLKARRWARILALILSVLYLFNVPVGTAVGIYSLWALTQQEAEALFE